MLSLTHALQLQGQFGALITAPVEFRGETTVTLADAQRIAEVCSYLKQSLAYDYLVDISSVDHYGEEPRFLIVYELAAHRHPDRLRLHARVSEAHPELPSVTAVWRGAEWHEREIYDMMGIRFTGHPDLRRLLMWDEYPYFPLRKEFPLAGKSTDFPPVALTRPAPQEGGPFVTKPGQFDATAREPRARIPQDCPQD